MYNDINSFVNAKLLLLFITFYIVYIIQNIIICIKPFDYNNFIIYFIIYHT